MKGGEEGVRRGIYECLNDLSWVGMVDLFNGKFEN